MKALNENQYTLIKRYLPEQRGNVKIANLTLINAVVYIAENGCKWGALKKWTQIHRQISWRMDYKNSFGFRE
jgi:hypothetical protein